MSTLFKNIQDIFEHQNIVIIKTETKIFRRDEGVSQFFRLPEILQVSFKVVDCVITCQVQF